MGSTDPNTPIALRLAARVASPARPGSAASRGGRTTRMTASSRSRRATCTSATSRSSRAASWCPRAGRIALQLRGKDYEYEGEVAEFGRQFHYATRGTGGMTHNDPRNRPAAVFDATVTLHTGGDRPSFLLLPVVPPRH